MTTEEVANKVVELVRKQAWYEALDTLYQEKTKNVRSRRLYGEGREDRARRISAARRRLIGALRPR